MNAHKHLQMLINRAYFEDDGAYRALMAQRDVEIQHRRPECHYEIETINGNLLRGECETVFAVSHDQGESWNIEGSTNGILKLQVLCAVGFAFTDEDGAKFAAGGKTRPRE